MFNALTGCDTVSSFVGHGKKTAWAVFPELTYALFKVSSAPTEIPQEVMTTIERFVILLFDQINAESIPPTKAALEEHVKRAILQGGHVWGQVHGVNTRTTFTVQMGLVKDT